MNAGEISCVKEVRKADQQSKRGFEMLNLNEANRLAGANHTGKPRAAVIYCA
ncbi:hypothetical protein [Pseudomonas pohangensis]|uniref:hypothetical protein n=1 Tax=Pseudomonas pohangensis TaxID=364197 RepID=UPI0012FD24B6|nr:hypothetical protein [Pseudomonas pohangensis]